MTIGELSRRTGVNIETIRYYEKTALMPSPPRTDGGRRVYEAGDVHLLVFIRRARELGFPVHDVRALLDLGGRAADRCGDVCAIADRHLASVREKIADLQRLEQSLARAINQCGDDRDARACGVIEALLPG